MWSDGRRFQLLDPTLDKSQLQHAVEPEGSLPALPLDDDDPPLQAYFGEVKRHVEAAWIYPQEAVQQKQSGSEVVAFAVKRDGRLGEVTVVRSTNSVVLDRSIVTAIRLAAPFRPIPCKITEEAIRITLSFQYVLHGPSVLQGPSGDLPTQEQVPPTPPGRN